MKKKRAKMGISTVYRTLELLSELNFLQRCMDNREARYCLNKKCGLRGRT
ncbi:hypothetical protein GCM10008968_36490 [Bacillus horti]